MMTLCVCLCVVLAVPANTVTEEVVTEDPQPLPSRKRKLEVTNNHNDTGETVSGCEHETDSGLELNNL